jgi:tRNA U38,U39,U40 pseudouridine synthase TruA
MFEENKKSGSSVPAHGLYLKAVAYPSSYFSL